MIAERYTYILIDVFTILFPLLFSFHPALQFSKRFKAFFAANGIIAIAFIIWDAAFTHWGVWGFNNRYLLGIRYMGLPLEEMLFFVCIPFACVFSYHCFSKYPEAKVYRFNTRLVAMALIVVLVVVALLHINQLYTSVTFIATALFLVFIVFIKKYTWVNRFMFTYLVMLIPFFIVNGILTGTGLEEPVVWYNPREFMQLRMGTIPVEDSVYGFLLVGLNIWLMEYLEGRRLPNR